VGWTDSPCLLLVSGAWLWRCALSFALGGSGLAVPLVCRTPVRFGFLLLFLCLFLRASRPLVSSTGSPDFSTLLSVTHSDTLGFHYYRLVCSVSRGSPSISPLSLSLPLLIPVHLFYGSRLSFGSAGSFTLSGTPASSSSSLDSCSLALRILRRFALGFLSFFDSPTFPPITSTSNRHHMETVHKRTSESFDTK
jgi:hypothetical protein